MTGASDSTSSSWLEAVRRFEDPAWERLSSLYGPLVYGMGRARGLREVDARDLTQEVFRKVADRIQSFQRDPNDGSFRGWLKTIARNEITDRFRRLAREPQALGGTDAQRFIREVPAREHEETDSETGADDFSRQDVLNRALELVKGSLDRQTWQAFWQTTVLGRPVQDVAEELGVTKWAVYKAKKRVLKRIQDEFGDLID